ncbi:hypothetical protein [Rhodopirellula bahusiensis]|uniref:hypothetical protein n=2 Tax=Rhodopirellula bahusiensis TaxID=2014065 RepID=UPI00326434D6
MSIAGTWLSGERACHHFRKSVMLIDGHNRYEICTRLGIEYRVSEMQFDCRDDAENWIDVNQAGKRNLGPISFRIVSGRIYNRRKKKHGGERRSKDQIDPLKAETNTAAEVASELGVGEATIKRNGQRAALHDDMVAIGDKEAAEAVKTLPQADVLLDEDGDSMTTHVRSSLAAAVCAVTIELSDLVEPYED